jgi:outer membrane protein OmpA-like peptidoglycan-associated protein
MLSLSSIPVHSTKKRISVAAVLAASLIASTVLVAAPTDASAFQHGGHGGGGRGFGGGHGFAGGHGGWNRGGWNRGGWGGRGWGWGRAGWGWRGGYGRGWGIGIGVPYAYPYYAYPYAPILAVEPPPRAYAAVAPRPYAQAPVTARTFTVYFDFDRFELSPEAVQVVDRAVEEAKRGGVSRIEVTGYTDLAGSQSYNLKLSQRRADIVRDYMVAHGIGGDEIAVSWDGKANPRVPTPDGTREPQNRRVEIVLGPSTNAPVASAPRARPRAVTPANAPPVNLQPNTY